MTEEIPLQDELCIVALFFAIWLGGKIMQMLNSSPLLGHILAGMLLGPALANIVPYHQAFILLGSIGVMLFVVQGGVEIQFSEVKKCGVRAFFAAFTGVLFPVIFIVTYVGLTFQLPLESSIAAGAALAPTSMGFSAKLLEELGQLDTPFGILVKVTAIFDDVLSIIILAEIIAIGTVDSTDEGYAWEVAAPIVGSLVCIIFGLALACPYGIPLVLDQVSPKLKKGGFRKKTLLLMLLILSTMYAFICAGVGSSPLLGCFLAGISFSYKQMKNGKVEGSGNKRYQGILDTWDDQLGKFVDWGLRLFFACTIGFDIPALIQDGGMFSSGKIVGCGVVLALLAFIGKMFVGFFAEPSFDIPAALQFGIAMNGRGEFSFLIASYAYQNELLDKSMYSSVVLGSVLVSFLTPFAYRLFNYYHTKYASTENEEADDSSDSYLQEDEESDDPNETDDEDDYENPGEKPMEFPEFSLRFRGDKKDIGEAKKEDHIELPLKDKGSSSRFSVRIVDSEHNGQSGKPKLPISVSTGQSLNSTLSEQKGEAIHRSTSQNSSSSQSSTASQPKRGIATHSINEPGFTLQQQQAQPLEKTQQNIEHDEITVTVESSDDPPQTPQQKGRPPQVERQLTLS